MPPYKTGSKGWHIENDTNEERLWAVLFEDWELRQEINEMIKGGAKINAIKALKAYAEENFVAPKRDCSLRELKNVIESLLVMNKGERITDAMVSKFLNLDDKGENKDLSLIHI